MLGRRVLRTQTGLDREGRTAGAGRHRIGVADYELRTFEVFFKVNFGANQILHRQRIHKESHPVALNDFIVFRGFFLELETVLELDVDLLQGYFLARPSAVPGSVSDEAFAVIQAHVTDQKQVFEKKY